MNDQSRDAARAIKTNNKSSDNVDWHVPADACYTQPGDQDSSNICVNLEDSKFSSQQVAAPIAAITTTDEFNREYTSGKNSPFDANEGMLAQWRPIPTTKSQKPFLTVADAWKFGVTYKNGSDNFTFVSADLHCSTCGFY